ncbi:MAG TPA: sulfatase [Pelobium sp.]
MKLLCKSYLILILFSFNSFAQVKNNPNVVYVIVDQFRADATGFNGNKDVITPNLDKIAKHSVNLKNAISGMPVCTPYRAQLMSGMYPIKTGVFMNDVMLDTNLTTLGKVYKNHGYNTGFIGKWHIDGHGRQSFIPKTRRQGFEYWKTLECTHNYNDSHYYANDSPIKRTWEGYDALAQSEDAANYIKAHAKQEKPFLLFVSLGPPHDPYQTAPEKFRALYRNKTISINPNVPKAMHKKIDFDLRGYYSHITAIDAGIGEVWDAVQNAGIADNTIFIFTSDHGDLMGAHGQRYKQQPYNESIKIPFLISYPKLFGKNAKTSDMLLNSPDIMPTLLSLSNLPIPSGVQGKDLSGIMKGDHKDNTTASLISCLQPFGTWSKASGGKEYRGVYTKTYTYVKDLDGPWLLFDNQKDPFQQNNLVGNPKYASQQKSLEKQLKNLLKETNDDFKPGSFYIKKWNYTVDSTGTVPYTDKNYEGKVIR